MRRASFWLVILAASIPPHLLGQINAGSNGSDGALSPTTSINIDMHDHPNGIYQYTSVNIPSGVTVTFTPNANNTPVVWLVQSNVVISGTIDVSGQNALGGGAGGPGGWAGGSAGSGNNFPSSGLGPGGGAAGSTSSATPIILGGQASYGTVGIQAGPSQQGYGGNAASGPTYGNQWLIPLLGGSGGGGGPSNAGGGGGGLLIAANNQITIGGNVLANGGDGVTSCGYLCVTTGAGGSGGAVRLVALTILGGGSISASGGSGIGGYNSYGLFANPAGDGRVRFDTFLNSFNGGITGVFTQGYQPIIIPAAGQGVQLNIMSIGGVAVSASPTGQLLMPDAIVPGAQVNPIPVVVSCANLPLNTAITLTIKPATGSPVSVVSYNTVGTSTASTATFGVNMPRGGGIIYATATTGN